MPSVERLKQRLNSTLKAKKIQAALLALAALAEKQPEDPVWPKCSARLLRATYDPDGELVALRRTLDLEVDQRHVVDAIATCRNILEVEPADQRTLDCLDLLNLSGAPADPSAACVEQRAGQAEDVPLDSLLLTQVVPGARSVLIADAAPGCINEIPIEALADRTRGRRPAARAMELEWQSGGSGGGPRRLPAHSGRSGPIQRGQVANGLPVTCRTGECSALR